MLFPATTREQTAVAEAQDFTPLASLADGRYASAPVLRGLADYSDVPTVPVLIPACETVDYGLVTDAPTEFIDYGFVTDAPTEFVDFNNAECEEASNIIPLWALADGAYTALASKTALWGLSDGSYTVSSALAALWALTDGRFTGVVEYADLWALSDGSTPGNIVPSPLATLGHVYFENALVDEDFDGENGGSGTHNYTGFANWTVFLSADLVGNGFEDQWPGNGLYVDLVGTLGGSTGGIVSDPFAFVKGRLYTLRIKIAGNARTASTLTTRITVSGIFQEDIEMPYDTGFTEFVFEFSPDSTATETIQIIQTVGSTNVGNYIKEVSLIETYAETSAIVDPMKTELALLSDGNTPGTPSLPFLHQLGDGQYLAETAKTPLWQMSDGNAVGSIVPSPLHGLADGLYSGSIARTNLAQLSNATGTGVFESPFTELAKLRDDPDVPIEFPATTSVDYGFVTDTPTVFIDYGFVTDAATDFVDFN